MKLFTERNDKSSIYIKGMLKTKSHLNQRRYNMYMGVGEESAAGANAEQKQAKERHSAPRSGEPKIENVNATLKLPQQKTKTRCRCRFLVSKVPPFLLFP